MTIILETDPVSIEEIRAAVMDSAQVVSDVQHVHATMASSQDRLIIVGPSVASATAHDIAKFYRSHNPLVGVILLRRAVTEADLAEAVNSGIRSVLKSGDIAQLQQAIQNSLTLSDEIVSALGLGTSGQLATTILMFAAKGGVGKTTIAVNLAVALTTLNPKARVCLVDLDLEFGDSGIYLNLPPANTLSAVGRSAGAISDSVVDNIVTPVRPGLDVIIGPASPTEAEFVSASQVAEILQVLRKRYDFLVVDSKASFSEMNLEVFDIADRFEFVTTLDVPAIKNLRIALETLDKLGYPWDKRHIILNRANSKVGLAISETEHLLGAAIETQLPSSGDIPSALNNGTVLYDEQPRHPFSKAIKELAQRISAQRQALLPGNTATDGALVPPLRTSAQKTDAPRNARARHRAESNTGPESP